MCVLTAGKCGQGTSVFPSCPRPALGRSNGSFQRAAPNPWAGVLAGGFLGKLASVVVVDPAHHSPALRSQRLNCTIWCLNFYRLNTKWVPYLHARNRSKISRPAKRQFWSHPLAHCFSTIASVAHVLKTIGFTKPWIEKHVTPARKSFCYDKEPILGQSGVDGRETKK